MCVKYWKNLIAAHEKFELGCKLDMTGNKDIFPEF